MERDASEDVRSAINDLWSFYREHPDTVGQEYARLKRDTPDEWNRLDRSRRLVHKLYLQLMQARLANLLTDEDMMRFLVKSQLETAVKILAPIEAENPGFKFTKSAFDEYRRLFENYEALYFKYFKRHLPA